MNSLTILDGGMGRELKRMGAPFRQPEWSALALIEAPSFVLDVHSAYVKAGADIITTNSYALVPFHIGDARFESDGEMLADRAGKLARQAANRSGRSVRVAASLPPLFGSYRPDLFNAEDASRLLAPLVKGLSDHADLWLAETLSATQEAEVVANMLAKDGRPLWISFTLEDGAPDAAARARLRSGEAIEAAVALCLEHGVAAVLFNCSQPEVMEAAARQAKAAMDAAGRSIPIGVYANAFPPQPKEATANETLLPIREDLDPAGYLNWVRIWLDAGADIIGGCCGIGPEHIEAIARLRS
ncbi:homocysteine S-methyltransferase family protein [Aquisediminimonas profunda]|uniref:homocysteine S-methyltransferase family protein n=1 Tax=Aquisediminimonas profunda TaxID=1550733 RepID=UPI001C626709|nr:homocysteine S-methyltransferase family protein [Aquisediminimonas profunda]